MAKQVLPTYSIHTLTGISTSVRDFVGDGLSHYLDEHRNLRFPHRHSFFHLVYFSRGSGTHSIDFVGFPVQPGQLYFMVPGQVHSWHFATKPDGYIVNFSPQYIHTLIADPGYLDRFDFLAGKATDQVIRIPRQNRPQVEQLLRTIVEEGNSKKIFRDDFTRTALLQLFISVSRIAGSNSKARRTAGHPVLLQRFLKLIDQHYKEKKLTKDYAAMLHVTPNHLNALCKERTGQPAGELIRNRVLLEAKRLLVNAELSVSQIAAELDFADNSYFSRFFKKYESVSPETFRKKIKI